MLDHLIQRLPAVGELSASRWRTTAAVAVVLRPREDDFELLFIRRSHRPGDPWSGHIAFPGGVGQEGDVDAAATARRETEEEVGLTLGEPVAKLGNRTTPTPRGTWLMRLVPLVFLAPAVTELTPDRREVADSWWMSWRALQRLPRERRWFPTGLVPMRLPCIEVNGHPLWGLTLQMVDELAAKVG